MYDRFNRHINYLRISVTDRCNLRCTYCMPEEGIQMMNHCDILSFEEIIEVARVAVTLGIDKFRITGGEPLVRKDIVKLIAQLASIAGVRDLSLTTNGIFLEELAQPLKSAGLHRVNISLDTLDPQKFREITRGGDINAVFRGITAARDAGIKPIKINCVVFKSSKEQDATEVKEFGRLNGLDVRFIRQMNLESGEFSVVEGGNGGNCHQCNRLRLTANGMVKPCLFDEQEFSVREFGAEKALLNALNCKPLNGCFNTKGSFYNIGG
ncbi:MAG TPA: radical SAM protein [Prolixibacteraceae bacterium]|nr:radical SAM protein [Prolixibacteraceae bacterium]